MKAPHKFTLCGNINPDHPVLLSHHENHTIPHPPTLFRPFMLHLKTYLHHFVEHLR